jgi:hypothetical protein
VERKKTTKENIKRRIELASRRKSAAPDDLEDLTEQEKIA